MLRKFVVILLALALGLGPASKRVHAESKDGQSTEADITLTTARLLAGSEFSRWPLDERISAKFLDSYLDDLDGARVLFTQGDLDQFENLRPSMAQMAAWRGETRPAHIVFSRYLQRLAQQVHFQTKLLRSDKFDFTGNDSWQTDRHDALPALDLAAAKVLWREEAREDYLREKIAGVPPAEIAPNLIKLYENRLQMMRRLKPEDVLEIYLDSLAHVYDPHSDYLGRQKFENLRIQMDLSLVGVGATLQAKDGYCEIVSVVPGGPAARSGLLKPGDRIVAVAHDGGETTDILDMPPSKVAELLRGPKATKVRLVVVPAGADESERRSVTLVRDEVAMTEGRAKASIVDLPQTNNPSLRVGVIELPSFYGAGDTAIEGASVDTAHLIIKLKREGVSGIILDLRGNRGGALEEAIWVTGLFIPSGPVVQTRGSGGEVEIDVSPENEPLYNGPLVVLTSRLSASASEIVAGALQDYGRALIVGDSCTFGKGTVQAVVPLDGVLHGQGLGAVKVTVRKFYRPSGASTQRKGVASDIVLPSATDQPAISEASLPNALPWDILPSVDYPKFDLVGPVLDSLRSKSHKRVAADPVFHVVGEEQAVVARWEKTDSLLLNEALRRQDKAKVDEIKSEADKALAGETAHMPPTYDITLQNVDSPGLPQSRKPAPLTEDDLQDNAELCEAENILADYIHALRRTPETSQWGNAANHVAKR